MVADWYDGFVLESEWIAAADGTSATYRLILSNHGRAPLADFRLGISGPARISDSAEITNGRVVTQLSNFCELSPPPGFVLEPGARWTIEVRHLDYPIRHWTDGATAGFVIRADNTTLPAVTLPTRFAGSDKSLRKGTMRLPVPADPPVPVSIIPWPKQIDISGRRSPPMGFALVAQDQAATHAVAHFTRLAQRLFPGEGLVRPAQGGGFAVEVESVVEMAPEAYSIDFATDRARVEASSATGLLYGLVTLGQMQRGARLFPQSFCFPTAGRIEDGPEMGWRGCHLDVARRFYARDETEQFLAIMAWNKLNRFHWHLSDDEGFRLEIDAYPELVTHAAWRGYGLPIPPLLGSGPEKTGGFYRKDDVRAIVALAAEWGIEVVPEIDVPGHCFALLEAMPELRDPGENGVYHSIQSFSNNCLNPAVGAVYPALETIFSEMIELFPSRYFHVGADEVPAAAWEASPAANAMRAELGVTGAAPLQASFLKRVQAFLTGKGKITGAWEEAAQGGGIDKANCYMVGWHTVEASQKLAAEGYNVVVAPGQAYYLDMANGEEFDECGAGWAGWSSPETTYAFDPTAGWSDSERKKLLGVQACIWSEPMTDRAVFDRLVFPRLSAIAETGWTAPEARNYRRFAALAGLMPNLYGRYEER
jgi:hexosaminidase